jgi:hypothetical protein
MQVIQNNMGKPDVMIGRSDKAPGAGRQGVLTEREITAPFVTVKEGDATLCRHEAELKSMN